MSSEEKLSVDQLQVGKHLRMKSPIGSIDVHSSGNVLGAWLKCGDSTACVYATEREGAVIALYPKSRGLPFAISKHGVQLPTDSPSETPLILNWEQLKEIVAAFKNN